MRNLLLTMAFLIINSCSNPASPAPPVQICATLNDKSLELEGWSRCENNQLEIFTYDSAENIRTIIEGSGIGLHKAFVQYQRSCEVYTASRADVLVTDTENDLLSCGISFLVVVNEERIEGTIKINNMKIVR